MPKILSTSRANRDLVEIGLHIAQDSPRAADKFLMAIDRKCKMLARFPKSGRRREELAPGLRSFVVGSYVIFYRLCAEALKLSAYFMVPVIS